MRIVTLIEGTPGREGCLYGYGLSFYVETENHKLLVDTGTTDAFLKNAELLRNIHSGVELAMWDG